MQHARMVLRCGGFGVAMAAVLLGEAGCTHNHYYSYDPCAPGAPVAVVPGVVQNGTVCDVPTQVVGGSAASVASSPSAVSTPMAARARPPRVVVSEPNGSSRLSWRRSDPESGLATTRVEGGSVEEPTTVR
jgi:hypothetical protein